MTSESPIPKERALTEYDPEMAELVKQQMPTESDQVQKETLKLIEAIKLRAQVEAKGAGDLTRDAYEKALEHVRTTLQQMRQTVEQDQIFEKDRIEYSFKLLQMDAEKNWESIVKEASTFGDRLTDAAKAAWDALTAPRS